MDAEASPQQVWFPDKILTWRHGTILKTHQANAELDVEVTDEHGNLSAIRISSAKVHPVDPSHFLDLDNICLMNNMHEAPLLDLLRRRFMSKHIYTLTGNVLISVNPYSIIPCLYDNALQHLRVDASDQSNTEFSENLSPHVFSVANKALACMMKSLESSPRSGVGGVSTGSVEDVDGNQSVVISGESGAGKTENSKYVMSFLIQANKELKKSSLSGQTMLKSRMNSRGSIGQFTESLLSVLLESSVILEAFGNAKTVRNDNSSRFGKYIKLMYSRLSEESADMGERDVPELVAAVTDTFLLEKSRLVSVGKDERNYHIFYQLIRGLSGVDKELWEQLSLNLPIDQYPTLVEGGCTVIRNESEDAEEFNATLTALRMLHCTEDEIREIWKLLACLLHLSGLCCVDAHTMGGTNDEPAIITSSTIDLSLLAQFLGFEVTELLRCLTTQELNIMKRSSLHIKVLSSADVTRNILALVKWSYDRLFAWLVRKINLSHSHLTQNSSDEEHSRFIGILDIFGFEILGVNSFEQLCINLANERLQQQFNECVFVSEQDMYRSEGLEWGNFIFRDNQHVIDLISSTKTPQGLLLILEEHCMLNRGIPDDAALLASFDQTHEPIGAAAKAASAYGKPRFKTKGFVVKHFAGEVTYLVDGFLTKNNDAMQEDLMRLLRSSHSSFLRNAMNIGELDPEGPGYVAVTGTSESETSPMDSPALPDRGSKRVGVPKKHASSLTVSQQFRAQLDVLLKTLRQTQPHYIKCIKPNTIKAERHFEAPLVMEQLRYSGVLEVVRIRREGFPIRLTFVEFYRKYEIFTRGKPVSEFPGPNNCRDAEHAKWCCQQIAASVMQSGHYQIGHTLIFLQDDGLEVLASAVRAFLSTKATVLQSLYRGYRQVRRYKVSVAHVTLCQAMVRKFCCRFRYRRARNAVISIQWALLRLISHRKYLQIRELKKISAAKIQSLARMIRCQRILRELRLTALYIQLFVSSHYKGLKQHRTFLAMKFAALKIQLLIRQHQDSVKQKKRTVAAVKIQSIVRMQRDRINLLIAKFAAMKIQAVIRGQAARLRFYTLMISLIRLQAHWRDAVRRRRMLKHKLAITRFQAIVRGRRAFLQTRRLRRAVVVIQSYARQRKCLLRYIEVLTLAVTAQALTRRYLQRRRFLATKTMAINLQRLTRGKQTRILFGYQMFSLVVVQSFIRRILGRKKYLKRHYSREHIRSLLCMWNVRRKYLQAVFSAILVQSVIRRKIGLMRYEEAKYAVIILQSFSRMVVARKHRAFVSIAVIVMQSIVRMFLAREQYKLHRYCVIKIQSLIRAHLGKLHYQVMKFTVVMLQSWVRGALGLLSYRRSIGSSIVISAWWRAHAAHKQFRRFKLAIVVMQRNSRSFLQHLRFKYEIIRFHELLMGEDIEDSAEVESRSVSSHRAEVRKAIQAALQRRPTLSIIRNMWMEYCTACHSAVLGGDPGVLDQLHLTYRDMFEVNIKGQCAAHFLAERPSINILRAVITLLDQYKYTSNAVLRGMDDDDDDNGWFASKPSESARISMSLKQTISNSVGKDTLKKGWLKKKRGGMIWQRRYMVLTEDYIIYYKNEQSLHLPKFAIPLEDLSVQRTPAVGELVFEITSPNMPDKKTIFGSSSKKSMSFMSDSEQDLQEWILPLKAIAGVEESERAVPVEFANLQIRRMWCTRVDRKGNTALHQLAASLNGYRPRAEFAKTRIHDAVSVAAWLIEHGCDVNAQNDAGHTALHILASEYSASAAPTVGSRELMRCLILKGADGTKLKDSHGYSAMDAVVSSKQVSKYLKKFLTDLFKIRSDPPVMGKGDGPLNKLKGYSYLSMYVGQATLPMDCAWIDPSLSFSVYNSKGQLIERTVELLNPALSSIEREAYIVGEGSHIRNGGSQRRSHSKEEVSLYWGSYWHMSTPLQNLEGCATILIELRDGADEQDSAPCYWARYEVDPTLINSTVSEVVALSVIQNSNSAASRRIMLSPSPATANAASSNPSATSRLSALALRNSGASSPAELVVDCVLHRKDRTVSVDQVINS